VYALRDNYLFWKEHKNPFSVLEARVGLPGDKIKFLYALRNPNDYLKTKKPLLPHKKSMEALQL